MCITLEVLFPKFLLFSSSGYSLIWVSGIELIGTIMGVGEPRLSNTPEVCVIPLLESAVEAVSLGSSVSVSMVDTWPRVSSSSNTPGK